MKRAWPKIKTCWQWFRSHCRPATQSDLQLMEQRINMKLSELNTALSAVNTTLEKVQAEVQKLKDSLADVDLPADAQASLDRLTALAAAIDEINPDA